MSSTTFRQKVQSGLLWSLVQNWGLRFGGLIVFMFLARVLTPSELGLFAAATTVVALCALFVESGLSEAVVQQPEVNHRQLNSIFAINLGLAMLAVLGLWLFSPMIAAVMKLPELTWVLRISSLGMLISAACFGQNAMYRRKFEYRALAMASLIATLVSGALALAMASAGHGTWSLVAQSLSASALTALILWRHPQWNFSFAFDFPGTLKMVSYGFQRLLTALMDFANTRFIELFFAATLGASALGLYIIGTRIYQALMQTLCTSILDIAHNAFSRLAHDRVALQKAYYAAINVSAAIAVPIFCVTSAVTPELTLVVFGPKWTSAASIMAPMLLLGAVQVLQFYNGIAYNAMGRPDIGLIFITAKTIITLGCLYAAKDQTLNTIVVVFVLSQLSITPISFIVARRIIGISLRTLALNLWPFIFSSTCAVFFVQAARPSVALWTESALAQLVLLTSAGFAIYFVLVGLLARQQAIAVITAFKNRRASV